MMIAQLPRIEHRTVDVGGVQVFHRLTGPSDAPVLLLLHGFPASSQQFRRLMDALGTSYRLVAPDYPGFGHTRTPDGFRYTFDTLAEVIEGFVDRLGLTRFAVYAFDFGGPIGFRLALRRPELISGFVIQNANAYEEGLSATARAAIANRPGVDGAEQRVRDLLTPTMTRFQYEEGASDPALIPPDGWTLDQHFLDQPGRAEAQVALALDYHSNVASYPAWQQYLRRYQPPALIVWGRDDPLFTEAGAHTYRRDLPDAELSLYDTGHFALEERVGEIAPRIASFLDRIWPQPMKIAVIGATGHLGGAAADEATARNHQVTRLSSADLDATNPEAIARAVAGHDAVIAGVKGPDRTVSRVAAALRDGLPAAGVNRLVFIGGGGSLNTPSGQRYVDAPDFPPQYRDTALDQADALVILGAADIALEWSYASPPPQHLLPGGKRGGARAEARDTPILNENGESRVTVGDYASAVVDAVEQRSFVRQRFTVAYPERSSSD